MDLRLPQLGVVEEESGLSGTVILSDSLARSLHSMAGRWTYVSFSKVTVADLEASAAADSGVTEIVVIFPLECS